MLHVLPKRRLALLLCAGLGASGSSLQARLPRHSPPADLVLRNGKVLSVDRDNRVFEAVAVRAGRIVYVGSDRGVAALVGRKTRVLNLRGRTAMPGLIDSHMHPQQGGRQLLKCSLDYAPLTVPQFQARIQTCLDASNDKNPDALMEVVNWFQQGMKPAGVTMTHEVLDGLRTSRPIAVTSSFYHSTLANRRAMALANITRTTADPAGGKIVKDARGEPSGLLEDEAQPLVLGLRTAPTPQDERRSAEVALAAMRKQGVTSFLDAAAAPDDIGAFSAVLRAGGLTARAHFAPVIPVADAADPDKAVATVEKLAARFDRGPIGPAPSVTVRNAKIFVDGVITAPAFTGAMLRPYRHNAGTAARPSWQDGTNTGPAVYFPPAQLAEILVRLARAGIDPHLHADGDRAVRTALDAIAVMRARVPKADIRPAVAHDEIVDPADFPRFRRLGAIAVLSYQWAKPAPDTIDGAKDYLGPARFRVFEPAGFLAAAGARIAFGSDWPVDPLDEWFALKVAVTRQGKPGGEPRYAGRLGADPGLTRIQALRGMTIDAAYALHQDGETGSIEVGKLADIIVIDRDILTVPADAIADTAVQMTIVGGTIVFEDDRARR